SATGSMACAGPAVAEARPRDRYKLPIVAARLERQLEDAEYRGVRFAVRVNHREVVDALAASSDVEFADAVGRIELTGGLHRGKPLVFVLLAVEHDVDAGRLENVPDRLLLRIRDLSRRFGVDA